MNSNEEDFDKENRSFSNEIQLEEQGKKVNHNHPMNEPDHSLIFEKPDYKFAGFWMRFWAYLLDIVVIGSINRIIVYPIFRLFDLPLSEANIFAPVSIITAIVFYAYFVLMTKYFGQTLGKMVFGLKVVSLHDDKLNWSTIMFREWIGRFISGTILILYIVVGILPKKQGIHDLFADTTVVHLHS
jgi:uncharacterized RDD family membrane protein YckC